MLLRGESFNCRDAMCGIIDETISKFDSDHTTEDGECLVCNNARSSEII